ncbi:MAG: SH3 domain-containing protein [Candidatus Nitrohelix vancouverensis]|uniref:SH3 domain-containing protein n=1 Tax=Candidatus Nitrohelix vancouverensis TaxID=2705534 RepID=A0A7T0C3Q8_9BACT|nr:MAG: SH3 domain-containing protein [Candidatus Nitrohelix vancouverensis]
MKDDLQTFFDRKIGLDDKSKNLQVCSVCDNPLAAGAAFCSYCGPPELNAVSSSRFMSPFRATFYIVILLVSFGVFFSLKLNGFENFKIEELWPTSVPVSIPDPPPEPEPAPEAVKPRATPTQSTKPAMPKEKRSRIMKVNVLAANVRDKPSMNGKKIGIVSRGLEVTVLQTQDSWTQIRYKGGSAWIGTKLLVEKK